MIDVMLTREGPADRVDQENINVDLLAGRFCITGPTSG